MPWGNNGGNDNGPWGGGKPPSGGGGGRGRKPQGGKGKGNPDIELILKKGGNSFKRAVGGDGDDNGMRPFIVIALGLLVLWFSSGLYKVDTNELGVEMRFGKYSNQSTPGLNYHLPYPIETVQVIPVTVVNREEVGFRSVRGGENRRPVAEESLMLTSDKNIVSTQFEVQWRIKDAVDYAFNLKYPQYMVKPVAETAMREVMGNTPLALALSDKRQLIADETQKLMHQMMDDYGTGIDVRTVNLLAVDAPEPVVDAFIDVLAAQQEKETLQNQAIKYRDGIVPVAQGRAEKMIKDAEGYKEQVVAEAEGQAARFVSVYNEYAVAKDITKKRMYLETMEDIMTGTNKIILDDNASRGVLPYLPLGTNGQVKK